MRICLFLETSVFLGYAFPCDHWETAATVCLSSPQKKFTSNTVENELCKKLEYSVQRIQRELLGLLRDLKKKHGSGAIGEAGLKRLKDTARELKIRPFLESMIPDVAPENTYTDFDARVRNILHQFLAQVQLRRTTLRTWIDQVAIESWLRVVPYDTLRQQLIRSVPNSDDVEILLDAHDLATNQNLAISFVTGDLKDIKRNETAITGMTRIQKIMYLDEFRPHIVS